MLIHVTYSRHIDVHVIGDLAGKDAKPGAAGATEAEVCERRQFR